MMTSSNGNIFRVTGPLCGEFTGPGEFPTQRPVTQSFDVLFDLGLNKPLSKQLWGWWFETPSRSLWCHCNGMSLVKQPKRIFYIYMCQICTRWHVKMLRSFDIKCVDCMNRLLLSRMLFTIKRRYGSFWCLCAMCTTRLCNDLWLKYCMDIGRYTRKYLVSIAISHDQYYAWGRFGDAGLDWSILITIIYYIILLIFTLLQYHIILCLHNTPIIILVVAYKSLPLPTLAVLVYIISLGEAVYSL